MRFMEDEKGNVVDGYRAKAMRDLARAIFEEFSANGIDVSSYCNGMPYTAKEFFRTKMATKFPEFRLCEGDWKADAVAITTYPGWKKSRSGKNAKNEPDPDSDSDDIDDRLLTLDGLTATTATPLAKMQHKRQRSKNLSTKTGPTGKKPRAMIDINMGSSSVHFLRIAI